MSVLQTSYLKGIDILQSKIQKNSDDYPLIALYHLRLLENLEKVRAYGDTQETSASRIKILEGLNEVTERILGCSFHSLYQSSDATPSSTITPQLPFKPRDSLIEILLKIRMTSSYQGRSTLLVGIPNAASLTRHGNIARLDLTDLIDQLDQLGPLASGEWPLLILVDNALRYTQGWAMGDELRLIREALAQEYKRVKG